MEVFSCTGKDATDASNFKGNSEKVVGIDCPDVVEYL